MPKWWKEIKTVGLKDWCWFVLYLRRNEFHEKLSLHFFYKKYGYSDYQRYLIRARQRAHDIDIKLEDVGRV